jgi:glycosyltransferase involved in cell wall biosynthesis
MKVLYDISILGNGLRYSSCRTGIFRAVESTLLALADQHDCQLSLTAGQVDGSKLERLLNYQYALQYWQASPQLRVIDFPHSPFRSQINKLIRQTGLESKNRTRKLLYATSLLWTNSRTKEAMSAADIYHQTAFPLSDVEFGTKPVARVTNLFDMTPLIVPQLYAPSGQVPQRFTKYLDSLKQSDWVICCSESTRSDFLNYISHPPERVHVAYLGADKSIFFKCSDEALISRVKQKFKIPDGPYILSLCALEPRKNMHRLISAFTLLIQQERLRHINLVLAGPAVWLEKSLLEQIEKSTVRNQIIFAGFVGDKDLAPLYSGASLFVYPSLYEGFGLPIVESMLCGTPVIAGNNSSMPEIVGDAGLLINAEDTEELSEKMSWVLNDSELRSRLSETSLRQGELFTWQQTAAQTMAVYKNAIGDDILS